MDPNLKMILDELKVVGGSVTDLRTSLTERIDAMESSIGKRFGDLEAAAKVFDEWRPKVDSSVEELRSEVGALRQKVDRVVPDPGAATSAGILPTPTVAAASSSAGNPVIGPTGHRVELSNRGFEFPAQLPVKGTCNQFPPNPHPNFSLHPGFTLPRSVSGPSLSSGDQLGRSVFQSVPERPSHWGPQYSSSKLPKMNFPGFDGENPKLWIHRCEIQNYGSIVVKTISLCMLLSPICGSASRRCISRQRRRAGCSL